MIDRLIDKFTGNPGKWILIGLLCFTIYSNYQLGKKFTQFCSDVYEFTNIFEGHPELLQQISLLSIDFKKHPRMSSSGQMNKIADMHERLMNGYSEKSEEYRYRYYLLSNIMKVCHGRLSPPGDEYYEYN
jgi:hypothetical protein